MTDRLLPLALLTDIGRPETENAPPPAETDDGAGSSNREADVKDQSAEGVTTPRTRRRRDRQSSPASARVRT